ncbi:indolepyruvate ferredoxin oxidoreductase family protein [Streptomyces sp. WM6386]|uniref:indolepyruvate ferredoxin oxidoreductase family protein n=1 Tax=Streptomyces sp. WM6386 TaxID=1415558 RepID=UPI000619AE5E|nr:indolepyruvate ferredoxin oxidoreductase family protein [Streptomyces sp. WM6386]KKD06623.1 2-oxoacid ferredoxin oxidoreductase [Streptomyces sp. WM6386]
MSAALAGLTEDGFSLEDRYLREDGTVYLTGVQALVRLLFDRARHDRREGRNTAAFVSGYEGSPLAGFDLELARRAKLLTAYDVVHRPGLNEELGTTAVMGSQLAGTVGNLRPDGVTGIWYGKSPGLDRASDAFRHANLAGTDPRGGAVALVGDDPVAKSSTVPCASEKTLADLAMPIFYPADPQDVLDHGLHAVELSRASGVWASMKIVTNVADAAGTAVVRSDWAPPVLTPLGFAKPYTHKPSTHLLGAGLAALERSLFAERLPLALEYVRASGVNRIIGGARRGDRIGIITAGKPYLDLRQALSTLGLDEAALESYGIRLLKLGAIHPVDPGIVREFADGLTEIIVVEEKRSFLESGVKEILYGVSGAPRVHGKTAPDGTALFSQAGELSADSVAAGLGRRLSAPEYGDIEPVTAWRERRRRERVQLPLLGAARTPYFCSGCPHNSSTKVPEGSLVGAGIGCHTMAVFMEPDQVGTVTGLTQMGGEGAQWIGMAPFTDHEHFVQNIGDGTFTHSGSLAVRAAAAAGVNITYKLLYNSAVAMTGGQDPVGGLSVGRVAQLLLVEGAAKVIITTEDPARLRKARMPKGVEVRHREELMRSQEELAAVPGVTVLIHDQECAAEKRRKRRRGKMETPAAKVVINERVCEGCGDCGVKSNCLSVQPVETEFGRKTRIDQSSCNVDYSCLAGDCPSFMTVVPSGRKPRRKEAAGLRAEALSEPQRRVKDDDFTVRITGVGGTGVVTVAQILATAAVIDGKHVRTLDQTGLAQKGGAVVSDVKVTSAVLEHAPKLADGECDLYLACDSLVGTDAQYLAAADPDRTVAVVSTTEVPTGRMIIDTAAPFPEQSSLRAAFEGASAHAFYVDARRLVEDLFGDDQYANILLLGAAYQTGALPLSAASIEEAIRLNGAAVELNTQAFRHGRQLVADPKALRASTKEPGGSRGTAEPSAAARRITGLVHAEPGTELARLLEIRVPELIAYQDGNYAREYAGFVESVRLLEAGPTVVTEAVARNLYKLMAYKDEYEVARLHLDDELKAEIEAQFGEGSRFAYQLHPPVFRMVGMKRKISLGPWSRPALRVLRSMRKVRGTRMDVFGYARVRRVERALVDEYRDAVLRALHTEVSQGSETVLELASLPDMVRGYEHIKLANVAAYRARQAELLARLARSAVAQGAES